MEEQTEPDNREHTSTGPKKWIVFGGGGFIGNHFVRYLKAQGHSEILVVDLVPPADWVGEGVKYQSADIRQPFDFDLPFQPDVLVNLAARAREPGYEADEYFAVNTRGAGNVLDFARKHDLSTVWFTSTMSTYGPREEACEETSPQNPETPYGISKYEAEQLHFKWQDEDPNRTLRICRPAVIFGRGEGGNFTRLARALKKGFFLYPGRNDTIKSNGYVLDLVRSLHFMGAQPDKRIIYNYSYPTEMTIREICETFCRVGGFRKPVGTLPAWALLTLARVSSVVRKGGDLHPDRVLKVMRSTNIHPTELGKRGFQFETNLESALERWLADDPKGEFV